MITACVVTIKYMWRVRVWPEMEGPCSRKKKKQNKSNDEKRKRNTIEIKTETEEINTKWNESK